jgi:glycosyltransferase involved in cell wall biosynthesis
LLVDPSLFTEPYDAALTEGLLSAGVEPRWAVRPARPGDRRLLDADHVEELFYRRTDRIDGRRSPRARALAKGAAHLFGLARVTARARAGLAHVVHFQWTVVPALDALAMSVIRRHCPVVLTVHDTMPFNGDRLSAWQRHGFDLPIAVADRVIVHTESGRLRLIARRVPASKVVVVPHGPLRLGATASDTASPLSRARYTFTLFGELKPYKGIDVLLAAVGRLPEEARRSARFVIAGRPQMPMDPVNAVIAKLPAGAVVEVRPRRMSEQELADLVAETDCFLFPYRQVDASGAYYIVRGAGKWIVASKVGVFHDELGGGGSGTLVEPGDPASLAGAVATVLSTRPVPVPPHPANDWGAIGDATAAVYRQLITSDTTDRGRPCS